MPRLWASAATGDADGCTGVDARAADRRALPLACGIRGRRQIAGRRGAGAWAVPLTLIADPSARDTALAMSQENVEIVRGLFEAFNRGDIGAGVKLIDEGVVFDARGMELENEDFARVYF